MITMVAVLKTIYEVNGILPFHALNEVHIVSVPCNWPLGD